MSGRPQPYITEFGPYPEFASLIIAQFHDSHFYVCSRYHLYTLVFPSMSSPNVFLSVPE